MTTVWLIWVFFFPSPFVSVPWGRGGKTRWDYKGKVLPQVQRVCFQGYDVRRLSSEILTCWDIFYRLEEELIEAAVQTPR